MNPLLDEKMILISSTVVPETFGEDFKVNCIREAYGPTLNEGLCFEGCFELNFSGTIKGAFYLGLDGYTRILLLPYLGKQIQPQEETLLNEMLFMNLFKRIAEMLTLEMKEFVEEFSVDSIETVHHKLISVKSTQYRKYMVIFFLKDVLLKKYLGRVYILVAIKKEI